MSNPRTLEESIQEIEKIVEKLEDGEDSLESSIELYRKGLLLLEACHEKMDKIEKELIIVKPKAGK